MTKHDEVRQILHDTGFKFQDGRSALEMTDEEVEKWLFNFFEVITKFSHQITVSMQAMVDSIAKAMKSLQELNRLLEVDPSRDIHGV